MNAPTVGMAENPERMNSTEKPKILIMAHKMYLFPFRVPGVRLKCLRFTIEINKISKSPNTHVDRCSTAKSIIIVFRSDRRLGLRRMECGMDSGANNPSVRWHNNNEV